jgi:hypothetical protein
LEALLINVLPQLANEVKNILIKESRIDLANQIEQLKIKKLCECGDPDCGSFYLTEFEEDDDEVEIYSFGNGTIEVSKGKISFIEIFPSNEGYKIRTKLKEEGIFY